jgi:indolepyruvate ferredoxin oxidoreductase, beta subunit
MYLAMCEISRLFSHNDKKETTESVGNFTNLLAFIASYFVNTQPELPVTVTSGLAKYPDVSKILNVLSEKYIVKAFNADELAFEAGSRLAMNVVMVGAVSGYLPIPKETLIESVKALVPQKTIEVNMRAFEMGRRKVEES